MWKANQASLEVTYNSPVAPCKFIPTPQALLWAYWDRDKNQEENLLLPVKLEYSLDILQCYASNNYTWLVYHLSDEADMSSPVLPQSIKTTSLQVSHFLLHNKCLYQLFNGWLVTVADVQQMLQSINTSWCLRVLLSFW